MNVPWSTQTGEAIGADWLIAALAPAGDFGRRAFERERAFVPGDEDVARAAIARVNRLARDVDAGRLVALRDAIAATPDPQAAVVRAQSGGVLDDVDFFDIARFLESLATIATLAGRDDAFADVSIPASQETLQAALAPGITPARSFYIDDAFDVELARRRGESAARAAEFAAARSRASERTARLLGMEFVRDGEFVLMREHAPAPLPREIRILREAPTYFVCELALDEAALDALDARERAEAAVAESEEAVRTRLTDAVASVGTGLLAACVALGELDMLVVRARVAQQYDCVVPEIAVDNTLAFESARYLPLAESLATRGLSYTPISLELDGVAIVTGPNMGGKTAALRTAGFLVACVALGMPVPATNARIPLLTTIAWLGLGAASERDGLSAFGAEIVTISSFLDEPPAPSLVLLDEFARTTSPREGRALLVALLRALVERRTLGLATTHYDGVAEFAAVAHFASGGLRALTDTDGARIDLASVLHRIAEAMDFRLHRVGDSTAAPSEAITLAEALGLDGSVIAAARRVLEP